MHHTESAKPFLKLSELTRQTAGEAQRTVFLLSFESTLTNTAFSPSAIDENVLQLCYIPQCFDGGLLSACWAAGDTGLARGDVEPGSRLPSFHDFLTERLQNVYGSHPSYSVLITPSEKYPSIAYRFSA
jgi:hypothetical protein